MQLPSCASVPPVALMGRFLSNADMVVDIKSLIGDGLRLGDANCPISMREAKAGNWPSSFDGCCVSAPDPNDVPSCAMAIKTIGAPMPINDCYESKFQAGESSHAWEVSISPYLLPDDASYRTCVLCFQPMYNFNYICPHCHMEQDSLHVRHDMPSQSMGWTPSGTGNDKLDFHKPCESKFRQAKQAHLSKDRVFTVAPTTLMIRNVPSQYTAEEIINEWPNEGDYDFLYVPYNARTQENLTYAFVNFTSHALAVEFKQQWQKKVPHTSFNEKALEHQLRRRSRMLRKSASVEEETLAAQQSEGMPTASFQGWMPYIFGQGTC